MSLVGKASIALPKGVEFTHDFDTIRVKGPKGELSTKVHPDFTFTLEEGQLSVTRPSELKKHKALHGLYRSLANNMVVGVSEGYKYTLELHGVGYRADVKGQTLGA